MKKLIALGLIVALYSASAFAQAAPSESVSYSWGIPTTRVDGSALPVAQIAGYEITYTVDGGAPVVVPISGGATAATSITLVLSARATPYILLSTIRAIDTNGLKSAWSPNVTTSIPVLPAVPSAPGTFKVVVTVVVGP